MDGQRHCLLLVQFNSGVASRTFLDYDTPGAAMDGVCVLYEKELQVLNPAAKRMHELRASNVDIGVLRTWAVRSVVFSSFALSIALRLA